MQQIFYGQIIQVKSTKQNFMIASKI